MQAHLVMRRSGQVRDKRTRDQETEPDDRQKDGTRLPSPALIEFSRHAPGKHKKQRPQNNEIEDLDPAARAHGKLTNKCTARIIAGTKPAFQRKDRDKERGSEHTCPTGQPAPVGLFAHRVHSTFLILHSTSSTDLPLSF